MCACQSIKIKLKHRFISCSLNKDCRGACCESAHNIVSDSQVVAKELVSYRSGYWAKDLELGHGSKTPPDFGSGYWLKDISD